jgi:hypothetical protein
VKILSALGFVIAVMVLAMPGCAMGPGPDQQTRELNEQAEEQQRAENLTRSLPPAR